MATEALAAYLFFMELKPEALEPIRALYEKGLFLSAWKAAIEIGDPRSFEGTRARIFARRLLMQVGCLRAAQTLHLKAWRDAPLSVEATEYAARVIFSRRGPCEAWRFLSSIMSEEEIQQPVVREAPALYRPRYPEQTVFYRLVRDHFEQFALVHEERFEASDGPLLLTGWIIPIRRRVIESPTAPLFRVDLRMCQLIGMAI